MSRREMFAVAGCAATVVAAPASAVEEPSLREVWRYSYVTDKWTRCRMWELYKGDVFRLGELGTFHAASAPFKDAGETVWSINCDGQIDPATNQWVPATPEAVIP